MSHMTIVELRSWCFSWRPSREPHAKKYQNPHQFSGNPKSGTRTLKRTFPWLRSFELFIKGFRVPCHFLSCLHFSKDTATHKQAKIIATSQKAKFHTAIMPSWSDLVRCAPAEALPYEPLLVARSSTPSIFGLPKELRLTIFQYYIQECEAELYKSSPSTGKLFIHRPSHINLLLTCRKFLEEGKKQFQLTPPTIILRSDETNRKLLPAQDDESYEIARNAKSILSRPTTLKIEHSRLRQLSYIKDYFPNLKRLELDYYRWSGWPTMAAKTIDHALGRRKHNTFVEQAIYGITNDDPHLNYRLRRWLGPKVQVWICSKHMLALGADPTSPPHMFVSPPSLMHVGIVLIRATELCD